MEDVRTVQPPVPTALIMLRQPAYIPYSANPFARQTSSNNDLDMLRMVVDNLDSATDRVNGGPAAGAAASVEHFSR